MTALCAVSLFAASPFPQYKPRSQGHTDSRGQMPTADIYGWQLLLPY